MTLTRHVGAGGEEGRGTQATAINEAEKNLWLIGAGGEVRVGDEAWLVRGVERTLEG